MEPNQTTTQSQNPEPENSNTQSTNSSEPVNYDELVKTDKTLQSWFDRKVTEATQTAVKKYGEKMKLIHDTTADENAKLSVMTPEQQADYWKEKADRLAKEFEARENGRAAREKAVELFEQNKIPVSFLDLHNLSDFNDDSVAKLIELYSNYEFYPKGTLEQEVSKALSEKLKQEPPQTVVGGSQGGFSPAALHAQEISKKYQGVM